MDANIYSEENIDGREALISKLVEYGSSLIDHGFPIIPCNGKLPCDGSGKPAQDWHKLPNTHARLEAGLRGGTEPALGMIMGPQSGIIDIETDNPDEEEAVSHLFQGCEPQVTVAYKSVRGKHTLYKYDSRLEALGKANYKYTTPNGKHVTIRLGLGAKASQSIIPPSVGREWLPGLSLEECDIQPLPELAIERLLASASNKTQTKSKPPRYGEGVDPHALGAMRKLPIPTYENDGSKRLLLCGKIAVEHNLSDLAAIVTVRAYATGCPFPVHWTDEQILKRLRDAEEKNQRGKALLRPRTDLGNGERFVAMHGDAVRYVPEWGKWLIWNGRYWEEDTGCQIARLAKQATKAIYREAEFAKDDEERDEILKWAKSSQSRSRLEAMIALAKSEPPIPICHNSLNSDPWLLNCENGTVDLRKGVLRPHDRADLLTKTTGIEYPDEPGFDAVLWTDFQDTIFSGKEKLIGFVQRLMGSALPGVVYEHILPIFYGSGSNGKSVFIETAMDVLGEYAMKAPAGMLMTSRGEKHPTELADLFGKRLVAICETGDGQQLDERLVKELTGGDTIRARKMRQDFWEFEPSHQAVLVTNHKPIVRGNDHGIWRRLRLVPFTVTISEDQKDLQLKEKLKVEWPAILKWLVQGCLDWQHDGLQAPAEVLQATDEYKVESDTLAIWMDENCEVSESAECKASDAYQDYCHWCDLSKENRMSQKRFGGRLTDKGFTRDPRRDGIHYRGFTTKQVAS